MGKSLGKKESPCCWGRGSLGKLGVAGTSRKGLGCGQSRVGGSVVGAGSELQEMEIRARVRQPAQGPPRLPSPTVLSGCNEELFQLKASGARPAAAAALASLQQGPGEPLCQLTAWPGVS